MAMTKNLNCFRTLGTCLFFALITTVYAAPDKTLLNRLKKVKDLSLSAEELAAMKWEAVVDGAEYSFRLKQGEVKTWEPKEEGNTPFRLLAVVMTKKDKRWHFITEGEGEIYLISDKNEIAAQFKAPLRNLCPT
jgi:hypothetical protein